MKSDPAELNLDSHFYHLDLNESLRLGDVFFETLSKGLESWKGTCQLGREVGKS